MFSEKKSTQLAAHIVKMKGDSMKFMHLLKVMYEADREMLFQYGAPITYDTWCAMHNGPVLSHTYDCIKRTDANGSYWNLYFSKPENHKIKLLNYPGNNELSDAEIEIAEASFRKFGEQDQFDVIAYMHDTFPEWSDPGKSSVKMSYEHVLLTNGFSQDDVDQAKENVEIQEIMEGLASLA
jgi:uncharacterized phage-associated protein